MPKRKPIDEKIPALFRRNALDHLMFGFVQGIRKVAPSTTVEEALDLFRSTYDLTQDDYPVGSSLCTFTRMQREFFEK